MATVEHEMRENEKSPGSPRRGRLARSPAPAGMKVRFAQQLSRNTNRNEEYEMGNIRSGGHRAVLIGGILATAVVLLGFGATAIAQEQQQEKPPGFKAKAAGNNFSNSKPLDVNFPPAPASGTEREKTLQSVLRIRDISEQYATGGLYLIRHFGDREALFEKENDELLRNHWINQTWRFCTIFSAKSADSVVIGRNWDNQNVGSVVASRYKPSKGYASVSFTRAIDLGFPLNVRIDEMAATPFGDKLLLAPFYAYDGINEQGLFASVTGVSQVKVNPKEGKRKVFIGYLVRKILDRCRTVEEAVKLVEDYVPFDLDDSSLNCHFFVADATGRSVILEYVRDSWKRIFPNKNWQVLTNTVVYDMPESVLRKECRRYKSVSEELEESGGRLDWAGGMKILKDVSQSGTTWSVVYLPKQAEIVFSVYQNWDRLYRLRFPGE